MAEFRVLIDMDDQYRLTGAFQEAVWQALQNIEWKGLPIQEIEERVLHIALHHTKRDEQEIVVSTKKEKPYYSVTTVRTGKGV